MADTCRICVLLSRPEEAAALVLELGKHYQVATELWPGGDAASPALDAVICDTAVAAEVGAAVLAIKQADAAFLPALIVLEPGEPEQAWLAKGFDYFLRRPLDYALACTLLHALLSVRARSRDWAQAEEARFRTLFNATGTATIVVEADQTISMANQECLRVTGYAPEELIGTKWTRYVAPESLALMVAYHEARRQDNGRLLGGALPPSQYETRLVNKTGEVREVMLHVRATPTGGQSVVSMLDVTDYRRAMAELQERERLFHSLFNEHAAVKLLIDPDTLLVVDANRAAVEFYGWPREELIGRSMDDINVSPPDRVWEARQGMLAGSRRGFELHHRTADGSEHAVEVFGSPIEVGGKKLLYAIVHDISERKKAEAEKLELERQLSQTLKIEAVGRLAGGIAHDLNNLLTTIMGSCQLILADEAACSPRAREDLQTVLEAANRAASLTSQILAFARQRPLRLEVVSLNETIRRLDPLLRRTLGEDIEILFAADCEPGLIEADVSQVEQVILNLAVNARDAMPKGGRLVLGTTSVRLTEAYCRSHPEATPGDYIVLTVSDTGIGMDEYIRSRIFEPFFTTKPPGQGTGLGLSTVYGIVKQSGGHITVYSEPGQGTTFKIYLPEARAGDAESAGETEGAKPSAHPSLPERRLETCTGAAPHPHLVAGSPKTVWVVEDEPALRTLIVRVLTAAQYEVWAAASADEALAAASTTARPPDLLLTDVVLPGGLRGDELAARLEFLWPHLEVIYMSGYAREHLTRGGGRLIPGITYLEKPFTPDTLVAAVSRALAPGD